MLAAFFYIERNRATTTIFGYPDTITERMEGEYEMDIDYRPTNGTLYRLVDEHDSSSKSSSALSASDSASFTLSYDLFMKTFRDPMYIKLFLITVPTMFWSYQFYFGTLTIRGKKRGTVW